MSLTTICSPLFYILSLISGLTDFTYSIFRKQMSFYTLRFSTIDFTWTIAPSYIFLFSNRFKMTRLNAKSILTKMIDFKSFRNRSIYHFKSVSMCKYRFFPRIKPSISFHHRARPSPTFLRNLNFFTKSYIGLFHVVYIPILWSKVNAI